MQNYQQVVSQLGGTSGTKLITPEEAVVLIDDLEATAPSIHQHYSDEVALAVRSALTDAELFISYNMPAKALGPLVGALPLAPNDLRINQRLAALHTRAGPFRRSRHLLPHSAEPLLRRGSSGRSHPLRRTRRALRRALLGSRACAQRRRGSHLSGRSGCREVQGAGEREVVPEFSVDEAPAEEVAVSRSEAARRDSSCPGRNASCPPQPSPNLPSSMSRRGPTTPAAAADGNRSLLGVG